MILFILDWIWNYTFLVHFIVKYICIKYEWPKLHIVKRIEIIFIIFMSICIYFKFELDWKNRYSVYFIACIFVNFAELNLKKIWLNCNWIGEFCHTHKIVKLFFQDIYYYGESFQLCLFVLLTIYINLLVHIYIRMKCLQKCVSICQDSIPW